MLQSQSQFNDDKVLCNYELELANFTALFLVPGYK